MHSLKAKLINLAENAFVETKEEAISTFSIDADGASYANTRRYLTQDNIIPTVGAVRTEEMINYFHLDYPYDNTAHPIALNGEVSQFPWNTKHQLVRIGIKGKPLAANDLPATNFVFLIDVPGSMKSEDKLPLLIEGFKQFSDELTSKDRVAIVTYAGSSGVALQSTRGNEKQPLKDEKSPNGFDKKLVILDILDLIELHPDKTIGIELTDQLCLRNKQNRIRN